MSTSERPFWTSLPARILMGLLGLVVLAALLIPTGGKEEPPPPPPPLEEVVENSCTRDLKRVLGGIAPGRLGISTGSADLAVELNRWYKKCGSEINEDLSQELDAIRELGGEKLVQQIQEERFLAEDVEHVRMSLLAKEIVRTNLNTEQNLKAQVTDLFNYVVNQIILVKADSSPISNLPATPYQSLIWGMGTAEHRAWVFSTLINQVGLLDTFIIVPNRKAEHWLVGVLIPGSEIHLYDLRLGLPIPNPETDQKDAFPKLAATVSDVVENPEILKQLSTDHAQYPLESNDFKELEVGLIGQPSLWSTRMAELQYMITPFQNVQLFSGLGKNALDETLGTQYDRVSSLAKQAEQWQVKKIFLWEFPTEQVAQFNAAQNDPNNPVNLLEAIFAGPQLIKVDPLSGQVVVDPITNAPIFAAAKKTLHAVRVEQLQGNYRDALAHFGPIVTSYKTNPSPLNEEAATLAALWIGISQLDSKRFQAAENSFDRFTSTLRQSRTQLLPVAEMRRAAMLWKASIQVQQQEIPQAIETLKSAQAMKSRTREEYLIKRWQRME